MLRRWWWTSVARYIVENGSHFVKDPIALSQMATLFEWYPGPLILSISTLHLLMHAFLNFALENAGTGGFVVVGNLQNMRRIDPIVGATSHDMVAINIAFVDWDLHLISSLSQI